VPALSNSLRNGSFIKIVISTVIAIVTSISFAWTIIESRKKEMTYRIHKVEVDLKEDIGELKTDFKEFTKEQRSVNLRILRALHD